MTQEIKPLSEDELNKYELMMSQVIQPEKFDLRLIATIRQLQEENKRLTVMFQVQTVDHVQEVAKLKEDNEDLKYDLREAKGILDLYDKMFKKNAEIEEALKLTPTGSEAQ